MRSQLLNAYADRSEVEIPALEMSRLKMRPERPRFLIRYGILWFGIIAFAVTSLSLWLIPNPVGQIQDVRIGETYNGVAITSLAANPRSSKQIWLGTMGSGLGVYLPDGYFFNDNLTTKSTNGGLLTDFILDMDVSAGRFPFGALVVANGADGAISGLQAFEATSGGPRFWSKPLIGLQRFPGLSDESARCVIASTDSTLLVVGTKGAGLGVYDVANHTWIHVATTDQGLPSNTIHDVASFTPPGSTASWFFAATDQGIAMAPFTTDGQFTNWSVANAETGLAGNDVRALKAEGQAIWYRTAGQGLGRIELDENGAPQPSGFEVLVTENRVPGLQDGQITAAVGTAAGPAVWFAAQVEGKPHVIRYLERPHDTQGMAAPSGFRAQDILSAAALPDSPDGALFGTKGGAWFFRKGAGQDQEMEGSMVGLDRLQVRESVIAQTRPDPNAGPNSHAVVKTETNTGVSSLQRASVEYRPRWDWRTLVGTGRFPGLGSLSEITCAAGDTNEDGALYFGTRHGIGRWNPATMEVSVFASASGGTGGGRSRVNETLDLAVSGGMVYQVTGDHALDSLRTGGDGWAPVVPSKGASLQPDRIKFASALGSLLALGEESRVSVYDARRFTWFDLPEVEGLTGLFLMNGDRLWASTGSGELRHISLNPNPARWITAATGVEKASANETHVVAFSRGGEGEGSVRIFHGTTAEPAGQFRAGRLVSPGGDWKFAAVNGDDLYLTGADGIHQYNLNLRGWNVHAYQDSLVKPLRWAQQNRRGFWMLDGAGSVFSFDLAQRVFKQVASQVSTAVAANDSLLFLRADSPEISRATVFNGIDSERVVVGRSLRGDLSATRDAMEWKGRLLTLSNGLMGRYDPQIHDWESFPQDVAGLRRFLTAGDALWAEAESAKDNSLLYRWTDSALQPVLDPAGKAVSARRIAQGADALYLLHPDGAVSQCRATNPTLAEIQFPAARVPAEVKIQAERTALVRDRLVLGEGNQILTFGPDATGRTRWNTVQVQGTLKRICQPPDQSYLLEETSTGVYRLPLQGGGLVELKFGNRTGESLVSLVAANDFTAGAYQRGKEAGLRVHLAGRGIDVIGDPLADAGATAAVMELSADRLLRLSEKGQLAIYDAGARSWMVTEPETAIRELYQVGAEVWGWAPGEKTLSLIGADGKVQKRSGDAIRDAAFFPNGAILTAKDGAVVRFDSFAQGSKVVAQLKPAPSQADYSAPRAVSELPGGTLMMVNSNGTASGFDWTSQTWLEGKGLTKLVSIQTFGGEVYFRDENQRILGPVKVNQGNLEAAPVLKVRQFLRLDQTLAAIDDQGSIFELAAVWEPASGPAKPFQDRGEIREWFKLGNLDFFLDDERRATVREGERWFLPEGQAFRCGEGVFLFHEDVLSGPLRLENPEAADLKADAVAFPEGTPAFQAALPSPRGVYLRTKDELFFEFDGKELKELADAPPEMPEREPLPGRDQFGEAPVLTNWRWNSQEPGAFQRRFGTQFVPVTLGKAGFDFEVPLATEIQGEQTWVHTKAGRLTMGDGLAPLDLVVGSLLPEGAVRGSVIRELAGERYLIPADQGSSGWKREGDDWKPLTESWRELRFRQPFLQSGTWKWRRGENGEQVEHSVQGVTETSGFSPKAGRFEWDQVVALGQAGGRAWVLTKTGIYALDGSGVGTRALALTGEQSAGLSFKETTSGEPGMLQRTGQAVFLSERDTWIAADHPDADEIRTRASSFRIQNASWKIRRDGSVERSLPQAPTEFAPVKILSDGRWDFESVNSLAVSGPSCFLATEAGLLEIQGTAVAGFWPHQDPITQVQIHEGKPILTLANGQQGELLDGGWKPLADPLSVSPLVRQGERFRVTHTESGSVAWAIAQPSGDFTPAKTVGGRFEFDTIASGAPRDGGVLVAAARNGLVEFDGQGEVQVLNDLGSGEPTFVTVRTPDNASLETLIRREGKFYRYETGWKALPKAEGDAAAVRAEQEIVANTTWSVRSPSSGGPLEFALRLDQGAAKPVRFDTAAGRFDFDQLLGAAPAAATGSDVMAGTQAGVQRLSPGASQKPARLWRQREDGLEALPVSEMHLDRTGRLFVRQGSRVHEFARNQDTFQVVEESVLAEQLRIQAQDPAGWNAKKQEPDGVNLHWLDQPVKLLSDPSQPTVRFAHNRIHAVASLQNRVVLGTEGGVVMLAFTELNAPPEFTLLSEPFMNGIDPLNWLIADKGARQVWAQSAAGRPWRIDASGRLVAESMPLPTGNAGLVHEDHTLVWAEPRPGQVSVQFANGKVHPAAVQPEWGDGTFKFLQLTKPASAPTLRASQDMLFWSTEAGIMQYSLRTLETVKLHAQSADGQSLSQGAEMVSPGVSTDLFARGAAGGRPLRFDAAQGLWQSYDEGQPDPFASQDLVLDSPIATWKRAAGTVAITLKNLDAPASDFFSGRGKARIDEVEAFAFRDDAGERHVLLGADGCVELEVGGFAYRKTQRLSFSGAPPRLATVPGPDGTAVTVAQDETANYYLLDSEGWKAVEAEQGGALFAKSYERVFQPERWRWTQFPEGLACTLLNTNGPPLVLGRTGSGTGGGLSVFSGETLAQDHVKGVTVTAEGRILAATTAGILRFTVDPGRQTVIGEEIDVWKDPAGAASPEPLPALSGLKTYQSGILAWNADQWFWESRDAIRVWVTPPGSFGAAQAPIMPPADPASPWLTKIRDSELVFNYAGQSRWTVPVDASAVVQDWLPVRRGLFVLCGNALYFADERRIRFHPLHLSAFERPTESDPKSL